MSWEELLFYSLFLKALCNKKVKETAQVNKYYPSKGVQDWAFVQLI